MKYYIKQFLKTYNAKFLIWACIVLGTLLFFHEFWKLSAKEHSAPTRQDSTSNLKIERHTNTRPFQEVYVSPQELKDFLKSEVAKYAIDYDQIYSVIMAESRFDLNAYNPVGKSYGVAQFIYPSFKAYCDGYYLNPYHQITCMVKMFKAGKQDQWDAWCLQHKGNKKCQRRGFK